MSAPVSSAAPLGRYAEDFLSAFAADWQRFTEALESSADLRVFLADDQHSPDEKKQLLRQVFEDSLDPFTLSLLGLLTEQGKLAAAGEIGNVAAAMLSRWRDMLTVRITTAALLSAAEEESLLAMLQERYGQMILLEKIVDAELIGGAVLRIGDRVFDGSIKNQLNALEKDLLK